MSTKEEIFNYVMETPQNTNPAVLRSLLNGLETGGGSSEDFIVTFSGIHDCDKTFEEIKAAYIANKNVKLYYNASWSGKEGSQSARVFLTPLVYSEGETASAENIYQITGTYSHIDPSFSAGGAPILQIRVYCSITSQSIDASTYGFPS